MTPEQKKEEVSKAYVHAVAARCGFAVGSWSQDQGSVDGTIAAVGSLGSGLLQDPKLDFQIKASSQQAIEKAEHIAFQLDKRYYDQLRVDRRSVPILLIVLILPESEDEWVVHGPEALTLRRCAYWVSLRGAAPISAESKVVHLPKSNVFSPQQLMRLMTDVSEERRP